MKFIKVHLESVIDPRTKESIESILVGKDYEILLEDLCKSNPVIIMDAETFKALRIGILHNSSKNKDHVFINTDVADYQFKIL